MMKDRTSFRQFFEELLGSGTPDVLWSWFDPVQALLEPLRAYGGWDAHARTSGRRDKQVDLDMLNDLWELYAFSRVSDILLLPYQNGAHDGTAWTGPTIGSDERVAFFTALGLERIDKPDFHPFYHEIVTVTQAADASSSIAVMDELWPGFMLDHLLICRAGVHVRAGRDLLLKEIAEGSTLYWSSRRKYRPYHDLSQGWGSNSQWRTEFRRDYTNGHDFVYNADGTLDARLPHAHANSAPEALSADERVELLINRCFVHTIKPHSTLFFPYNDTLTTYG
jgi:hypothetical protein